MSASRQIVYAIHFLIVESELVYEKMITQRESASSACYIIT